MDISPSVERPRTVSGYLLKKNHLLQDLASLGDSRVGLAKSTSNLFRHRQKAPPEINLKGFNEFVGLNASEEWADFEGMTTFEDCVAAVLPLGFMPAVVPELKTITIGGAVTGVGIESSSFKFGFVHEAVLEMDILTHGGEIITCSPEKNAELFFAFPNSYGTFGYALRVRMKVVPVKSHVEIRHHHYSRQAKFLEALENFCDQPDQWDFVEGVVFSPAEMVVTTGRFTENAPYASDYTYLNIYYQSLRRREQDYLKTLDYIWRWDTDWFWCSSHFLAQNPLVRRLYGKDRLRSTTYWKIRSQASRWGITKWLDKFTGSKEAVIQDVEIPFKECGAFLDFFHEKIGIRPIWVCPTRVAQPNSQFVLYPMNPEMLYLNFGFWDVVKTNQEPGYHNRLLEKKVGELQGKKSLYSDVYYSQEEFWERYNGARYRELKAIYDPGGKSPDLFQKCVQSA